jgi:molybdopterin molybdotransferase
LKSGQAIRPQEVGVLASLGISVVEVFRRPRIAILATGDELINVDAPLEPGKIRNSNGFTQAAQVRQLGAVAIDLGVARDSMADVQSKLDIGIESEADLFISSAGVSVGAHDVVKSVLEENGQIKIWRIRMRPGKPLVYAFYKNKPYLGLPGNPVSAMVAFEKFARPSILKMAGHTRLSRPHVTVIVEEDIKSDGRESYLRANVYGEPGSYRAVTTGRQGSHMLTSLVRANGLLVVPEGVTKIRAGEQLKALMLDWPEAMS